MIVSDNVEDLKYSLNDKELSKLKCFEILHKCPWYIRLFKKKPEFTYIQESNGIGIYTDVKCTCCGKVFDITDYNKW